MVTIVKYFIWTERLSDFKLYTETVALILPYFPAAGRGQYNAKASRFTLEQVLKYDDKAKAFFYSSGHCEIQLPPVGRHMDRLVYRPNAYK